MSHKVLPWKKRTTRKTVPFGAVRGAAMRMMILSLALFPMSFQHAVSQNGPLPAPIPTNQRNFSIPFEVRPDGSVDPPKEIELLVSKDLGVRWHSCGRLPIDGKRFDFKAESDGEYRFAFRTITLSGATKQAANGTPQIRVLVDSTPPELTLEMTQQASGQLLVHWKVVDRNLQGKRPDFAVAAAPFDREANWISLNVDGRHQRVTESGMEGSFLFWPENGVAELCVRAILTDVAGNRAEKRVDGKVKPVARDHAEIARETLEKENPAIASPNAPVSSWNTPAPVGDLSNDSASDRVSAPQPRFHAVGTPLTPPKPIRMAQGKHGARPKRPVSSSAESTVLAGEYQPPPSLGSPSGEAGPEAVSLDAPSDMPLPENDAKRKDAEPEEDDLSRRLLANMDRFFDDRLREELQREESHEKKGSPGKQERRSFSFSDMKPTASAQRSIQGRIQGPIQGSLQGPAFPESVAEVSGKTASPPPFPPAFPAASGDRVARNGSADSGERSKPEPRRTPAPGGITGISLNTAAAQAQIIVKWNPGDPAWNGALIDVQRGETAEGPWMPIATNLPNNGEYWWFITPDDLNPFHIMVRIRNLRGGTGVDVTSSPIRVDRSLLPNPK